MNLPKVITDLVKAQDNFDSTAYANCFTETTVVADEGNTYHGKTEIIWHRPGKGIQSGTYHGKAEVFAHLVNFMK